MRRWVIKSQPQPAQEDPLAPKKVIEPVVNFIEKEKE